MPTDQGHLIAFLVAQGAIVVLGISAYVYARVTAPKDEPERAGRTIQGSFDFTTAPQQPAPPRIKTPPMAGV